MYIYICTYAACYEAGAMCPPKNAGGAIIRGMDVIHQGHPANPLGDSSPATMCIQWRRSIESPAIR